VAQATLGLAAGIVAVLLMMYWCCAADLSSIEQSIEQSVEHADRDADSADGYREEAMLQDGVLVGKGVKAWSTAAVYKEAKAAQQIYSVGVPVEGLGSTAKTKKRLGADGVGDAFRDKSDKSGPAGEGAGQGAGEGAGEGAGVQTSGAGAGNGGAGGSEVSPSRVSFDVDESTERAKAGARAEKEDHWKINCSRMKMGRLIDRGSFGIVYEGTYNGMRVAVKKLIQQKKDKVFKRETTALKNLHHANIVRLVGTCADPESVDADGQPLGLCIVMEHCRRLSLRHVLDDSTKYPELRWSLRLRLLLGAARGMAVLHTRQPRVLHHDLKASNILISDDWVAKVSDFGMATVRKDTMTTTKGAGTMAWAPPESYSGVFDTFSDVYAFGMLMFEVVTRSFPWKGLQPAQVHITLPIFLPLCSPPEMLARFRRMLAFAVRSYVNLLYLTKFMVLLPPLS
jgi:tRNA A-37 threonylcarbamoyl transferase component Bud32